MSRLLLIGLLAVLFIAAKPGIANVSEFDDSGIKWATHGKTPVLAVAPVGLNETDQAALISAVERWNATKYVRYAVLPPRSERGDCYGSTQPYPCVPVEYDEAALGTTYLSLKGQRTITGVSVRVSPDAFYMTTILAHELGHVLGLNVRHAYQTEDASLMNSWTLYPCPTAYDVAGLAARYSFDAGTFTLPAGAVYPTGTPDCSLR